jgi:adenylylsulfate kinase-like enzyme
VNGDVYWITGMSGVGKTTIGTRLYYKLKESFRNIVLLDGDVIKKLFEADNIDYSAEGRRKRAFQYSELCLLLSSQGIAVICCTIAMFDDVREWNRRNISNYHEIFVRGDMRIIVKNNSKGLYDKSNLNSMPGLDGKTEFPKSPDVIIDNEMNGNVELYIDKILRECPFNDRSADIGYWDAWYKSKKITNLPSDFAKFSLKYMVKGYKLIDLGCGNGRDSAFFCNNGIKVTSIDSSKEAIHCVNEMELPIFAVCDDLLKAKALFCVDYDYIYARWVLHSITKEQQTVLIGNAYEALRCGGYLFAEARTVSDIKYGMGKKIGTDEYIFDGHYRRFLRESEFVDILKAAGFKIIFSESSDKFSVVAVDGVVLDSPTLLRVVARK